MTTHKFKLGDRVRVLPLARVWPAEAWGRTGVVEYARSNYSGSNSSYKIRFDDGYKCPGILFLDRELELEEGDLPE